MTTYTWPGTRAFVPAAATLRVVDNTQRIAESPITGDVQTVSMPGARWAWDFEFNAHAPADRDQVEAFLLKLNGREHRVRLWDYKRPTPRGTIALSGVTAGAAPQFAETIALNNCGANATILAGAWMSIGGQLLRVTDDAQANVSGYMVVSFRHRLRQAVTAGATVTLDRPTALYIRTESGIAMPRAAGQGQPGFAVQFVEAFS